jgi:hypothetical protein
LKGYETIKGLGTTHDVCGVFTLCV